MAELLEQLKEYENRTRYRARRELWARSIDEVRPAVAKWVASLKTDDADYDRLLCEAMWVLQGHRVVDTGLLEKIWALPSADARASAVKVVTDERSRIPHAQNLLIKYATDESPRVRIEAMRGLSFFPAPAATDAVIAAAKMPMDKWLRHEVVCALGATESAWSGRYLAKSIGQDPEVAGIMKEILKNSKTIGAAVPYLEILLGSKDAAQEERNKAMSALASMRGSADKGKNVIKTLTCLACHKIGEEGKAYGPALDKVGTRWNKMKIIESIIDPNAELHKDFITTLIEDNDGKSYVGLVIEDKGPNVVLFDSKTQKPITIPKGNIAERNVLKQSSMPEGLAGTMAPNEFLDVIEYLYSLK